MAGVADYLSPKVSGFLMKKELDYLGATREGWQARLAAELVVGP
jgi:3-phosphoglycerate kinase